ncbi:MAG: hypothetical protein HY963_07300 [Ignavibacteriales bacterium]|nr:hypothetical protein [Ignavibacteriales bacterium]
MSHVKIWVHAVWCTKNHERVLSKDVRQQLFQHVSESMLNKVRDYIKNQEEHHKRITFKSEYEEFTRKFGFDHHG